MPSAKRRGHQRVLASKEVLDRYHVKDPITWEAWKAKHGPQPDWDELDRGEGVHPKKRKKKRVNPVISSPS